MELILVRHGETHANHLKLIQGYTDNLLNDLGKTQAHEAGKYLKSINYKPDFAYSSSLSRAFDTGKIIMSYLDDVNIDIIIDDHFIERDFGPFEGELARPTLAKVIVEGFTYPGFEDDMKMKKRLLQGLNNLYKNHKGKKVIVFCHSHTIKTCFLIAGDNDYTYKSFIANGSLHKMSYDGKKLKLVEPHMNFKHVQK